MSCVWMGDGYPMAQICMCVSMYGGCLSVRHGSGV